MLTRTSEDIARYLLVGHSLLVPKPLFVRYVIVLKKKRKFHNMNSEKQPETKVKSGKKWQITLHWLAKCIQRNLYALGTYCEWKKLKIRDRCIYNIYISRVGGDKFVSIVTIVIDSNVTCLRYVRILSPKNTSIVCACVLVVCNNLNLTMQ